MKHLYNDFELNFDVDRKVIASTVKVIFYDDPSLGGDEEYVSWNPLGTYILYCDGGHSLYFTKKYLRINGGDYFNPHEIQRGFDFLKSHQPTPQVNNHNTKNSER